MAAKKSKKPSSKKNSGADRIVSAAKSVTKTKAYKKHKAVFIVLALLLVAVLLLGYFVFGWFNSVKKNQKIPLNAEAGEMLLHFVDVGQGDCIMLQFPDGKNMIIDGGDRDDSTRKAVLGYIEKQEIKDVEYLMLTHSDEDHCGSLDDIVKAVSVKHFYLPGVKETVVDTKVYSDFLRASEANLKRVEGSDSVVSASGMHFGNADAGYQFYIVVPEENYCDSVKKDAMKLNAVSPIMFLKFGTKTICFTGDSNEINEPIFLNAIKNIDWTEDGKVNAEDYAFYDSDILKVAHHGSETSSTQGFLDVVKPEISVIQAGKGNSYGHPKPNLLSRLANTFDTNGNKGSKVICTIDYGDVAFRLTNKDGNTTVSEPITSKTPNNPKDAKTAGMLVFAQTYLPNGRSYGSVFYFSFEAKH